MIIQLHYYTSHRPVMVMVDKITHFYDTTGAYSVVRLMEDRVLEVAESADAISRLIWESR